MPENSSTQTGQDIQNGDKSPTSNRVNPTSIIKETLEALAVPYTGIEESEVAGQTVYSIMVDNGQQLIGPRGETLRALNYIVKRIMEKRGAEEIHFVVDVNGYQVKQIKDIETRAKMMAERAKSFEYDVEMPPMSAYERLIVHATLSGMPGISTESQGEGRDRRVMIRYSSSTPITPES